MALIDVKKQELIDQTTKIKTLTDQLPALERTFAEAQSRAASYRANWNMAKKSESKRYWAGLTAGEDNNVASLSSQLQSLYSTIATFQSSFIPIEASEGILGLKKTMANVIAISLTGSILAKIDYYIANITGQVKAVLELTESGGHTSALYVTPDQLNAIVQLVIKNTTSTPLPDDQVSGIVKMLSGDALKTAGLPESDVNIARTVGITKELLKEQNISPTPVAVYNLMGAVTAELKKQLDEEEANRQAGIIARQIAAEAQAKADAKAKADAEALALAQAEAKAKADAQAEADRIAGEVARKAQEEADAKARAEAQAKAEADALAKVEVDKQAQAAKAAEDARQAEIIRQLQELAAQKAEAEKALANAESARQAAELATQKAEADRKAAEESQAAASAEQKAEADKTLADAQAARDEANRLLSLAKESADKANADRLAIEAVQKKLVNQVAFKPIDMTLLTSSTNELISAGATTKEATDFVVNAAFPPSKIDEMAKNVDILKTIGMTEEEAVNKVVTGSVSWGKYIPWAIGIGIVGAIGAAIMIKKKD